MQSGTNHQQVLIYHSKSTIMNYKCDVKLGSPKNGSIDKWSVTI
jgi:hypothetical protein